MGAWSAGLFGDDIACDVQDHYIELLRTGLSGPQASRKLLASYTEELSDEDDGPVIWLALAATQWQFGRLQPAVKARALRIIQTGLDLKHWEAAGQSQYRSRQRALEKLQEQLESPPRPEKPVRVKKPKRPPKKPTIAWKPGQIIVYRRDSGKLVLLLTEFVDTEVKVGRVPVFALLDWEGLQKPTAHAIRKLPVLRPALKVLPHRNQPPPEERFERLDGVRKPAGLITVSRGASFGRRRWTTWNDLDKEVAGMLSAGPRKKV